MLSWYCLIVARCFCHQSNGSMPHDNYKQFVFLAFLGLGLVFAALANLVLRNSGSPRRAFAALAASGGAIFGCWMFERDRELLEPLGFALIALLAPFWAFGTVRGSSILIAATGWMRQPLAAWRCCAIIGIAVVTVSAARFQSCDDADIDAGMAEFESLEQLEARTLETSFRTAPVQAMTDRGTPLTILERVESLSEEEQVHAEDERFRKDRARDMVIRRGPSSERCNCYGWVFTGGRFWIPDPDDVELILQENGYRETARPRHGDLVVYRRHQKIEHMAVVRYLARNQPVMVEGKWGRGGIYLHAVDKSQYGDNFTYMRSPRVGHILAGISGNEPLAKIEAQTE